MSTIKNVALVGASGNLGPAVLNAFLKNGSFNITAISRKESKATFPDSVKVIKTDLSSKDSLVSAFKGQDAVVIIVGTSALGAQKLYVDAAIEAGIKRFIPSEFGSDLSNPTVVEMCHMLFSSKDEVAKYLRGKESTGLTWTSIANGPFFDWGWNAGFLGFNAKNKTATIWDDGNAKFSTSNLAFVGECVVATLLPENIERTKNQHVWIQSRATSQGEILAAAEKITGERWKVDHVNGQKVLKDAQDAIAAGTNEPMDLYKIIQTIAFGSGQGDLSDHSSKSWNEKLGLKPEPQDLEADLRKVMGA